MTPRLTGTYDGGIHKTTVYGVVDARFFNADTIAATAGVSHQYEAMRDLIFNFYGNYTRQTDIFNSALQFNNGAIGPPATPNVNIPIIINPFGTTPGVNPIAYNQFTGGASVTKTFNQAFVTLSGTAFGIVYDHSDNVPAPFQTSHDGTSFWAYGKGSATMSRPPSTCLPKAMGFSNVSTIHCSTRTDTELLGALDRRMHKSLFRGEIYGGYWAQNQEQQQPNVIGLGVPTGIPTDANSRVFGGRLSYYPTRVLDDYSAGRSDIGNVNDAVALHSAGSSYPSDHRYPADDLWDRAGLVDRRPRRLHTRRIHWSVRAQ